MNNICRYEVISTTVGHQTTEPHWIREFHDNGDIDETIINTDHRGEWYRSLPLGKPNFFICLMEYWE